MADGETAPAITVSGLDVGWDIAAGTVTSGGVRSVMLWLDPSMLWLLAPLAEELGTDLFRLLIADNANLGADEDWHRLVAGPEFTQGFARWSEAVAASGWGRCTLTQFDRRASAAEVVVDHPWELAMQARLAPGRRWGCPFLMGKLVGLFFHAFGGACWAEEQANEDGTRVVFTVVRSARTIARELEVLRTLQTGEFRREVAESARRIAELVVARRELEAAVARQDQEIRRLSALLARAGEGQGGA